jgi:hypothetical protein
MSLLRLALDDTRRAKARVFRAPIMAEIQIMRSKMTDARHAPATQPEYLLTEGRGAVLKRYCRAHETIPQLNRYTSNCVKLSMQVSRQSNG